MKIQTGKNMLIEISLRRADMFFIRLQKKLFRGNKKLLVTQWFTLWASNMSRNIHLNKETSQNPNWPETNQLAFYKNVQGVERRTPASGCGN